MKIRLITGMYNEERMLPYFLKHYSFCDKITFLDDHSTDRSHEIINSYPNTEIILREQKNGRPETDELDGLVLLDKVYKQDRDYDWVIITCMDEFLYHPNLLEKLEEYKSLGVTVPLTTGYNMWSKEFPLNKEESLEKLITLGEYAPNHSKCLVFNPKVNINYGLGMHTCNPTGDVKYSDDRDLKVLHFVYMGYNYFIERRKMYWEMMSDRNKENGWGGHNLAYSKMTEEEYNLLAKNMTKIL